MCHKCGEEFANSSEFCRDEKTARTESETSFDRPQRRYCHRCGYKLTDKDTIPENEYIAELNRQIDNLEQKRNKLIDDNKQLAEQLRNQQGERKGKGVSEYWEDRTNGAIDLALEKGWIKEEAGDAD